MMNAVEDVARPGVVLVHQVKGKKAGRSRANTQTVTKVRCHGLVATPFPPDIKDFRKTLSRCAK